MRPIHSILITILLSAATTSSLARTWTDASGKLHVEAELVTVQYGKVWLLRNDGQVFGIKPEGLSKVDREFVRQETQRRAATRRTTTNPPGHIPYGPGRELCRLEESAIDESSGLANSRRRSGYFWTHNDSGHDARLFLFGVDGRNLGSCVLQETLAYDFEDVFSVKVDNSRFLVLGDVGNNGRAAPVQMLHVVEEPDFDPDKGLSVDQVQVVQTIHFSYEDDHRDCEAVGIDPTTKTILLVTKERDSECYVYALAWPAPNPNKAFSARKIATLEIPPVTAMDVSPDGLRAVVLTYGNAYEYVREAAGDWAGAFSVPPREIVVPERVQGESICYGSDGQTLYLTSEKRPTPLIEIPVLEDSPGNR